MRKKIFTLISALVITLTIQFSSENVQHEDAIAIDKASVEIMSFSDPYIDGMG